MGGIEVAKGHGYDSKRKVWRSTRQPLNLPKDETVDVIEWLDRNSPDAEFGDKLALVDAITEEQLVYRELKLKIKTVAAGLSTVLGVKRGDVVLLLSPNSVWIPVVCLGVMSLGAIVTTVNPLNTTYEISNQVKDSGAKFAVTAPPLYAKVEPLRLPTVILAIGAYADAAVPQNTIPFSRVLAADPGRAPKVKRRQSEVTALLYSSGTTGISKGVVLTHKNIMSAAQQVHFDAPEETRVRRYLMTLPMFHVYGLAVVVMGQLLKAGTLVILPRYEPGLMLRTVEKYRVTDLPVVPPMFIHLAKNKEVDNYDLSSVVEITSGAAPLGKDLMETLHKRFPSWSIRQGFGMTETTGIISVVKVKPDMSHFGPVGELISSMEGKIVNVTTGQNLAPYEQGEICVKGPNNMTGYLKKEKATADTIDTDGWLHTGDLGYFDERGQLWVVDRLKELIKYKGYQVAPAELEALLLTHPQILDAAVVPLPNPEAGEVPVGFVVRSADSKLTEKELLTFVSRQVAPFKRLRRVTFIEKIPKSAAGKILRRELTQKAQAKL